MTHKRRPPNTGRRKTCLASRSKDTLRHAISSRMASQPITPTHTQTHTTTHFPVSLLCEIEYRTASLERTGISQSEEMWKNEMQCILVVYVSSHIDAYLPIWWRMVCWSTQHSTRREYCDVSDKRRGKNKNDVACFYYPIGRRAYKITASGVCKWRVFVTFSAN